MILLRGEVIPIISLSLALHGGELNSPSPKGEKLGIVSVHQGRKVSYEIDEIYGFQQIVLKKTGNEMADLPGIVSGAVLGNGEPGLVLDLNTIAGRSNLSVNT